ncbi:MAG: hypothetical protein ACR2M0_09635 [Chloroflexia bacterium]
MLRSLRLGGLLTPAIFVLVLLAACDTTPVPTATPVPPTPTPVPTATPVPATGGPLGIPASPAEITLINDAITKTVAADSYHYNAALEIPGMVANTTIVGDYKSPDAAHMSVTGGGKTTEIVNIGQTTYIKNPDGSWTSGDVSQAAGSVNLGSMGAMAGNIDPTKTSNIVRLLAGFVSGINSANKVGSETISGTQTTRYNVPVFLGNLMGSGGSTTPGEQPLGYANVWIDPGTKLIHRLNAHIDLTDVMRSFAALGGPTPNPALPSPTPLPPVVIDMNVELSDFGKAVEIAAPANATPAIPGVPTKQP